MVDIHQHEELLQQYNLRVLETQSVLVIQVRINKIQFIHSNKMFRIILQNQKLEEVIL